MRAPGFWWRPDRTLLATLLSPLGAVSGARAAARLARPGFNPGVPVICVGNPTVGGAGKTPTALYLARHLIAAGRRPLFLTRGYGGAERGPLLVDPPAHFAAHVGDEALLLARAAPTVLARDRVAGARLAVEEGADVIVMDDGFQNPALAKALSLLVVDAAVGVGNGLCLPAGPLRAPLEPQLARAAAMLLIGEGEAGEALALRAADAGAAVLRGRLAPDARVASLLFGRRVLAFAGIGRPAKFFETLRVIGANPVAEHAFGDHQPLGPADAARLIGEAQAKDLLIVTTEKDAARLAGTEAGRLLSGLFDVLPVRLVPDADSARRLDALMAEALAGRPG
ncbi:tetraacyldisaccharide 4'-kinase [Bosea sp. 117]|uniref:tetraacyldisaccharide 4'-kinase n=1 Tax=Bosea sp. 117 TaxID=1125973 RepID=UPI000493E0AF|nr:tetraacyldisaccharide 4'-kinase [Bosea sp. 117]